MTVGREDFLQGTIPAIRTWKASSHDISCKRYRLQDLGPPSPSVRRATHCKGRTKRMIFDIEHLLITMRIPAVFLIFAPEERTQKGGPNPLPMDFVQSGSI